MGLRLPACGVHLSALPCDCRAYPRGRAGGGAGTPRLTWPRDVARFLHSHGESAYASRPGLIPACGAGLAGVDNLLLMEALGGVVEISMLAVLHLRQNLPFRRTVALQFIGDDDTRYVLAPLEQLAEELLRGLFVSSALYENIQYGTVLIYGAPEIVVLLVNGDEHLVQIPFIVRPGGTGDAVDWHRLGRTCSTTCGWLRTIRSLPRCTAIPRHHGG